MKAQGQNLHTFWSEATWSAPSRVCWYFLLLWPGKDNPKSGLSTVPIKAAVVVIVAIIGLTLFITPNAVFRTKAWRFVFKDSSNHIVVTPDFLVQSCVNRFTTSF